MAKVELAPGFKKTDLNSDAYIICERNGQHFIRKRPGKTDNDILKHSGLIIDDEK